MNILLFLGGFILNCSLHYPKYTKLLHLPSEIPNNENNANNIRTIDYKKGYCDFAFNHPDDSEEMLTKIKLNFHKKKVLDAISRNGLSTLQKIDIIKRDTDIMDEKMGSNILAGDLLDDWEFII